ncbi:DUF6233 domain-containing protein [Streptomyces sp. NPDC059717]|uniref:DUF6233 domain-containing protein n=1 Tax=Streptomyces sp. NPDC059717 TaxID=3346922 RepID=UPI0036A9C080
MTELPPDPGRLRAILAYLDDRVAENETVGIYLRLQQSAVREALARTQEQRSARPQPRAQRRSSAPAATDSTKGAAGFTVERQKRAVGPEPARIHTADCTSGGAKHPIGAQEARAALTDPMVQACPFCRPDAALGMDLD